MFRVIDSTNRNTFAKTLEQIVRVRHPDVLGEFCRGISRETALSQFDDMQCKESIFFIDILENGTVASGVTLIHTQQPVLAGTEFPDLFASGHPVHDDNIYEMSRLFLTDDTSQRPFPERLGELLSAAFEFLLTRSATHVSLICDLDMLKLLLSFDLAIVPLGIPADYGKTLCVASLIEISPDAVTAMRQRVREISRLQKNFH